MSHTEKLFSGPYNYEKIKPEIFKEENQKLFLAIRDQIFKKLKICGAITLKYAIQMPPKIGCMDSFTAMACVDRLVELGEIKEIPTSGPTQNKIFTENHESI